MRQTICIAFVLFSLCLLNGCNKRKPVTVHPVSGQVLYAGAPAMGVRVFLLPTSAPMMPDIPANPHGVTGADGRFTLTTFTEGDGAAEGGYQVILFWPEERKPDERDESDSDRLLGWYSGVHSRETAQITAGPNTLAVIDIPHIAEPPAAVNGVPGRN
jgi:hypothetical protein